MAASQQLIDYYNGLTNDRLMVCIHAEISGVNHYWIDEIFDTTVNIDGIDILHEARALQVQHPNRDSSGTFESKMKIDDVDRALWLLLKDVDRSDIQLINVHLVLVSTMKNELSWKFKIDTASFDGYTCSIDATKPRIVNKKFPLEIYEASNFKGLGAI
jgi:hypothetical protein